MVDAKQIMTVMTTPNLRVLLVYSSPAHDFQQVVDNTRRRSSENNCAFELRDIQTLAVADEERLLNDIRNIPPQVHGQVKSGGGRTLPISKSGRLNRSIPILIFYDGPKPVDVYPKELKGIMYDLGSAFNNPGATNALGMEECITAILSSRPQILDPDLKRIESEFDSGSGVIDLVFEDSKGLYLIIEVKETADQETVGQILKQSNGMKNKLGLTRMRSAIVALGTSGNVQHACQAAGIELYLITARKQV